MKRKIILLISVLFFVGGIFFLRSFQPWEERSVTVTGPGTPIAKEAEKKEEYFPVGRADDIDGRSASTDIEVPKNDSDNVGIEQEKVKKEEKKEGAEEEGEEVKIISRPVSWGFERSRAKRTIDAIIIHSSFDALGDEPYDVEGLIAEYKTYGVSPHYLVDRQGRIYQLVADDDIAYHAGDSRMPDGRTSVNDFSIGIEVINTRTDDYEEKQYRSLDQLIGVLIRKYGVEKGNILGHKDIAPGRKTDPWNFDWKKI